MLIKRVNSCNLWFEVSHVAVIRCKLHFMREEVDNQWWIIIQVKVTPRYCSVSVNALACSHHDD